MQTKLALGILFFVGAANVALAQVSPSEAPASMEKSLACVATKVSLSGKEADVNVADESLQCKDSFSTLSQGDMAELAKDRNSH